MLEHVFVGREPQLRELHAQVDKALSGQGQASFITGSDTGQLMLVLIG